MNAQKGQLYFLLTILIGVFVLIFFIFRPFLYTLVFAAVFAIVFQPAYKKILSLTRGHQEFSALATIFIILVFVFTPLTFLGIQIFQEIQQLYVSLMNGGGDAVLNKFGNLINNFQFVITGSAAQNFYINTDQYLKQGLHWLLQNFSVVFSNFLNLLISFFVFLIALYYLFKDGKKLKKTMITFSPLTDANNEIIFKKLEVAVNSVTKGRLIVAVVQGALAAIGFAIFGVPSAVLWGSVTAITALIPNIGIALTFIPTAIFLFLTSGLFYGLGLLAWGSVVVGLVDNLLGPKLISTSTQLHPLAILLSVIGGMIFFGPIGFLLGPLTLSLFFALLDVYLSLTNSA